MVATTGTVSQIDVRPPTRYFHLFNAAMNKTPFLQARIKRDDGNMILCEWRDQVGQTFEEWIFKGSPQIMRLFAKFDAKERIFFCFR